MKCQVEKLEHFRHFLLFEFNRDAKAAEAARNICTVYCDNAIRESMGRKWFSRFKEDRFDITDTPRSGKPLEFDEDHLNTLIHNDPCQCTRKLATVSIPSSCDICNQWARLKKIRCIDTTCSRPKPQKSMGGHTCISVRSSSIGS